MGGTCPHLAEGELDVAGAGREVHDQVVQRAPLAGCQQLLDHACARGLQTCKTGRSDACSWTCRRKRTHAAVRTRMPDTYHALDAPGKRCPRGLAQVMNGHFVTLQEPWGACCGHCHPRGHLRPWGRA